MEDEEIRKWCISHFKECINVIKNNEEYKEYLSNKVIVWLEKQGENISLPKFSFNDVLALQCCIETAKKVQEDKGLYEMLLSHHSRLYNDYWLKKIQSLYSRLYDAYWLKKKQEIYK